MSSLSEQERVGLDDLFLCLGEKQSISEKVVERKKRLISTLSCVMGKSIPAGISLVKSKKIMFKQRKKMDKFKLFNYFRPKNRGSK